MATGAKISPVHRTWKSSTTGIGFWSKFILIRESSLVRINSPKSGDTPEPGLEKYSP